MAGSKSDVKCDGGVFKSDVKSGVGGELNQILSFKDFPDSICFLIWSSHKNEHFWNVLSDLKHFFSVLILNTTFIFAGCLYLFSEMRHTNCFHI